MVLYTITFKRLTENGSRIFVTLRDTETGDTYRGNIGRLDRE